MMLSSKRAALKAQSFALLLAVFTLLLCVIWFDIFWTPVIVSKLHLSLQNNPLVALPAALLANSRHLQQEPPSTDLPVYYINLNSEFSRRDYIRHQLRSWGFHDINRVSAWTSDDVRKYVKNEVTSIPNIMTPNDKEIACIASHLHAMLLAVEDTSNTNPYALIVEDDVSLEMPVDWQEMIDNAPKDFTILQLTTSNSEAVKGMWGDYVHLVNADANGDADAKKTVLSKPSLRGQVQDQSPDDVSGGSQLTPNAAAHQWVLRKWGDPLWSTQAYLIHKQHLKERLYEFINLSPDDHRYHVHLRNPDKSLFSCVQLGSLCVLPFRLVADIVLYAAFPPTYMTRIPIFNGGSAAQIAKAQGLTETSSISDESRAHKHQIEFDKIETTVKSIQSDSPHLLPAYFKSRSI